MRNEENKKETFDGWGMLFILANVLLFFGICVVYNATLVIAGLALFVVSGFVLLGRVINFNADEDDDFPWWWGGL